MFTARSWSALFAAALSVGCGGPTPVGNDSGVGGDARDAAVTEDAGTQDVATQDVATVPDVAPVDVPPQVDSGGPVEGDLLTMEVPSDLAVAAGYVYYTYDTTVRRIPLGGGPTETFYRATMSAPQGIAADADGVAWTERFASSVAGSVRSCPHAGCPATPMAYSGGESTGTVALAPTRVAWTSPTIASVFVSDRAMGGGSTGHRAAGQAQYAPTSLVLDGDQLFWTTAGIPIPGGAPGGTPGTVLRSTVGGSTWSPTVLAEGAMIGHPQRIALGPGVVFFLTSNGLFRVGRDGTGLTRLATVTTGVGANTFDLATDGTTLYWAIGLSLYRCAAAACTPETITSLGSGFTQGLEVDATSVYWGTMNLARTGGIRRFAR